MPVSLRLMYQLPPSDLTDADCRAARETASVHRRRYRHLFFPRGTEAASVHRKCIAPACKQIVVQRRPGAGFAQLVYELNLLLREYALRVIGAGARIGAS